MDKLIPRAAKLGVALTEEQVALFETFYRELVAWNQKANLTAITGLEEVQLKHFLDSLTAVLAFDFKLPGKTLKVIDIGTGAGFPGLPLKIVFPDIRLTLLESIAKKTTFLDYITDKLGLIGVEIVTGRAEELAHDAEHREKYGLVLSRAVASMPTLVELALPFCALGGIFIAYKKGDIHEEMAPSGYAIDIMGGRLKDIVPVSSELFDDARRLIVIEKVKPSPEKYPRRPGMPEKRPLLS
jgi:16S rRNA (guanine527-N7)-methyltransferase